MIKRLSKKFATVLLMAMFTLPQYPNAQKIDEQQTNINGVRMIALFYATPDAPEQVMDFYKKALENDFELIVNGPPAGGLPKTELTGIPQAWLNSPAKNGPEFNLAYFIRKDDKTIGLNLICSKDPFYDQTVIQISYNLDPYQSQIPSQEPESDVAGKDVYWLRRYPDSMRVLYADYADGGFAITYEAKTDCLKCVLDYYRQELIGWGWGLIREEKQNPDWANKSFKGLSDDLAAKLKTYTQAVAKAKELNPETYFLEFKKENEGRCVVIITFLNNRARAVIRYLPHANP